MGGRGGSSGLGANQRYTQKEQTVKNNVDLLVESYFKATGLTEGRLERKYEISESSNKVIVTFSRKNHKLGAFAPTDTVTIDVSGGIIKKDSIYINVKKTPIHPDGKIAISYAQLQDVLTAYKRLKSKRK